MKKSLMLMVFTGIVSLLALSGCSTVAGAGQVQHTHVDNLLDVESKLFIHNIGNSYIRERNYIEVSLNWNGDGVVMFLSSSSALNDEDILELIGDGSLYLGFVGDGMRTIGGIREINGKQVLLSQATSNDEIRWGLYGIKGGYVGWYGYRYFYVITTDTINVSDIIGMVEVRESSLLDFMVNF